MANHQFASDCDGALYDTRAPNWSASAPLRAIFKRHYARIDTAAQFKATLRAGAYAWPGGYPIALITSDGAAVCFDCGRAEARNIFDSIANKSRGGWRVIACDIIEPDESESETLCDHCGKAIGGARQ